MHNSILDQFALLARSLRILHTVLDDAKHYSNAADKYLSNIKDELAKLDSQQKRKAAPCPKKVIALTPSSTPTTSPDSKP